MRAGRARVVILLSGAGSTAAALIAAAAEPEYGAQIVAVGSDIPDAGGLQVAARGGLPTFVCDPASHPDREAWNHALLEALDGYRPDLVVCAGFMRILAPGVVTAFAGRMINTHPALLPSFPGAHGVRDALAYGVKVTGATVHYVDEGVDTGQIIAQTCVPVLPDDDESTLHERIKAVERTQLVEVVAGLSAASAAKSRP